MMKAKKFMTTALSFMLTLALIFASAACGDNTGGGGNGGGDKPPVNAPEEYWVEKIEVTTDDAFKTSYYDGEPFDTTGMNVKATWNDGYVEESVSSSKYYVVPSIITDGVTSVTVHYGDASQMVAITSFVRELVGLDMLSPPSTTMYADGDMFNPAGLILRYKYNDNSYEAIEDYDVANVEFEKKPLEAGQQTVRVSYGNYFIDIPISVKASAQIIEMESGTLVGPKIKKKSQANADGTPHWMQEFASGGDFVADINEGDAIALSFKMNKATKAVLHIQGASNFVNVNPPTICRDLTLNEVMNVYVNGTELTLSSDKVMKGKDNNKVADKWLWVQWVVVELGEIDLVEGSNVIRFVFKNPNGFKQPYEQERPFGDAVGQYDNIMLEYADADAKAVMITEITASEPTETEYVEGEFLDKNDVKVTAKYEDGTEGLVRDYEIVTGKFTKGTESVTLGCGGKTVDISGFTVIPRVLTSLELTNPPTKTEYEAGETFDPSGIVLTAVYNDGRVRETVTEFSYPVDKLYAGTNCVTVGFGGMNVEIPVTVRGTAGKIVELRVAFDKPYSDGDDVSVVKESDVKVYAVKGDGTEELLTSGYTLSLPKDGKIVLGKTTVTVGYSADKELDAIVPVRASKKIEILDGSGEGCIGENGGNATIADKTNPSGGAYVKNVNNKTLKYTFETDVAGMVNLTLRGSSTYVLAANQGEIGEMLANKCMTLVVNGVTVDIPDTVKFIGKSKEDCAGKGVVNLGNWCDLLFENIRFTAGTNTVEFRFITPSYTNYGGGNPSPYLDTLTVDFGV